MQGYPLCVDRRRLYPASIGFRYSHLSFDRPFSRRSSPRRAAAFHLPYPSLPGLGLCFSPWPFSYLPDIYHAGYLCSIRRNRQARYIPRFHVLSSSSGDALQGAFYESPRLFPSGLHCYRRSQGAPQMASAPHHTVHGLPLCLLVCSTRSFSFFLVRRS